MVLILGVILLIAMPTLASECDGVVVGPVSHVRDADTLVIHNQPIRLQGIAAPERKEPGGLAATAAMRRLVLGQAVLCDLDGTRSYDRCVGICYLVSVGIDLADEMVRTGHARDCPQFSAGRYREAEAEAASARATIRQAYPLPGYCQSR